MPHAALESLLGDIVPTEDEIVQLSRAGETLVLRYEDLALLIEEDEARSRYLFTVGVGTPGARRAGDVHRTILKYNLLRRETGTWMALDEADQVTMLAEASSEAIRSSEMRTLLANVVAKARSWRVFVAAEDPASPVSGSGPTAVAGFDDLFLTGIRI